MTREATLVSDIEAGPIHDSGRIAFGPDDRLYVATGDAGNGELAQDDGSLNGKFLRAGAASSTAATARSARSRLQGPPQPAGLRLAGDGG